MDKIKQLALKCGLSEETATKLCESIDSHLKQKDQERDQEFQSRLAKAKQVCVEEVKAHKAELSRRTQIFLEAKNVAIEEQINRQLASRQAEAVAKLERIAALVEGFDVDGQPQSELKGEITKLRKWVKNLSEERKMAVEKNKRLKQISERVLKRNRELESTLLESRQPQRQASGKIDESRQSGRRQTTQPTIQENIDRRQPQRAAGPDRKASAMETPRTPEEIAAAIID